MQERLEFEVEQQKCTNCLKEFPIDRIDLHEAYCCRNIRKCVHCPAMIDIKDMEDHISQQHAKKPCVHCAEMFEPSLTAKHETQCLRRPIICKFCENQHAFAQLGRHQEMCGARTQPCTICHKLISLKDFQAHEGRCARRREERNQISQDNNYRRPIIDRERQNSTNNLANNRSNSIQNQNKPVKPHKIKPTNVIGPELIKPSIDPIPISVRLAMRGAVPIMARNPLKSKN